jgi:hypothetical protein
MSQIMETNRDQPGRETCQLELARIADVAGCRFLLIYECAVTGWAVTLGSFLRGYPCVLDGRDSRVGVVVVGFDNSAECALAPVKTVPL